MDLIVREEAELMLEEDSASRSRVMSQSSNSSWVDIMDEEVRRSVGTPYVIPVKSPFNVLNMIF